MTTVVSFEAGTISDCMKKAARVAPSKIGSAFDKAAGIVFDLDPNSKLPCVIRATDTQTFYLETIDVVNIEGEKVRWRLPSQLLGNVIGTIPALAGRQVKFEQISPTQVQISSGRMRVKLNLNTNPNYPEWEPADSLTLTEAPNFGECVTRVEWAAAKSGLPPLNGVHIDGEYITATDKYKIARVPCKIDLDEPVTIPTGVGNLVKQAGDVKVGMDDKLFVVAPDEYTQFKTVVFGSEYAPIERIASMTFEEEIKFNRSELIDKIQKATNFSGSDRMPVVELFLGREELAVMMENMEIGLFGDVIELAGQAEHKRIRIRVTPDMMIGALSHSPSDMVTLKYSPSATNRPILIEGDSGYQSWIVTRSERTTQGDE